MCLAHFAAYIVVVSVFLVQCRMCRSELQEFRRRCRRFPTRGMSVFQKVHADSLIKKFYVADVVNNWRFVKNFSAKVAKTTKVLII